MSQKKLIPLHRPIQKLSSKEDTSNGTYSDNTENSLQSEAPAPVVGDAVGVTDRQWFVALVGQNTEKACRERLQQAGYDCYVATQQELRQWRNGRRTTVERVVITGVVFVHVSEQERRQIVTLPFVKRFLTDRTRQTVGGLHPLATVSKQEMQQLRFMLYQSDYPVLFASHQPRQGDRIRVVRGQLKGFEGSVTRDPGGDSFVVASLGILGCAMVQVPLEDVQIIS